VIGIDDRGKIKLSMRAVDQATGEDLAGAASAKAAAPS
jgi:predicted RNA-binding protein with RPS1 domain